MIRDGKRTRSAGRVKPIRLILAEGIEYLFVRVGLDGALVGGLLYHSGGESRAGIGPGPSGTEFRFLAGCPCCISSSAGAAPFFGSGAKRTWESRFEAALA